MADLVTTAIQANGYRNAVVAFTDLSDGTGETAVTKVNATSSGPYGVNQAGKVFYPGVHLVIWRVAYTIRGMAVRIQWDATTDQDAIILALGTDELDFSTFGGLRNPPGLVGATGSINFTTVAAGAGDTYFITLFLKKGIPQG